MCCYSVRFQVNGCPCCIPTEFAGTPPPAVAIGITLLTQVLSSAHLNAEDRCVCHPQYIIFHHFSSCKYESVAQHSLTSGV